MDPAVAVRHKEKNPRKIAPLTLAHLARVARPAGTVEGLLAGPAGSAISTRIYVAQLQAQTKHAHIIINVSRSSPRPGHCRCCYGCSSGARFAGRTCLQTQHPVYARIMCVCLCRHTRSHTNVYVHSLCWFVCIHISTICAEFLCVYNINIELRAAQPAKLINIVQGRHDAAHRPDRSQTQCTFPPRTHPIRPMFQ